MTLSCLQVGMQAWLLVIFYCTFLGVWLGRVWAGEGRARLAGSSSPFCLSVFGPMPARGTFENEPSDFISHRRTSSLCSNWPFNSEGQKFSPPWNTLSPHCLESLQSRGWGLRCWSLPLPDYLSVLRDDGKLNLAWVEEASALRFTVPHITSGCFSESIFYWNWKSLLLNWKSWSGQMAESVKWCLGKWIWMTWVWVPSIPVKSQVYGACLHSCHWGGRGREILRASWLSSLAPSVSSNFSKRSCLKK